MIGIRFPFLVSCLLLLSAISDADLISYDGFKILEVSNVENEDFKPTSEFMKLLKQSGNLEIIQHNKLEKTIQIILSAEEFTRVTPSIRGRYPVEILEDNLGRLITQEQKEVRSSLLRSTAIDNFMVYRPLEEIESYLSTLEAKYPGIVEVKSIGKTGEERDIWMVRISNDIQDHSKEVIILESGIHAREWIAHAAALHSIERILNDEKYRNIEWRIIPVLNPDGYKYSWTNNRLWRKNRSSNGGYCSGVDLNRNFDIFYEPEWEPLLSCLSDYPGRWAFSEAESRAVRDHLREVSLRGRVWAYMTIHNYGQEIVYPPGGPARSSFNTTMTKHVVEKMAMKLLRDQRITYKTGTLLDVMYEARGTSLDWAFFIEKIPIALSIELRDKGRQGFLLRQENIPSAVNDLWAALQVLHEEVNVRSTRKKLRGPALRGSTVELNAMPETRGVGHRWDSSEEEKESNEV